MTVCRAKRRSFVSMVFMVVALFTLAGCRIDAKLEVKADGKTKVSIVFEDTRGTMAELNQTCEDLRIAWRSAGNFAVNAKMEDITPPGGHLTCRSTSDDPIGKSEKFSTEDGRYTFTYPRSNRERTPNDRIDSTLTVTMPGKVVHTTVGKIDGNKVIIKGLDYIVDGFTIVSQKEPQGSSSGTAKAGKPDATAPKKADGGFPVWGWGLAGASVLVVVVGVIVAAAKRRGRGASGTAVAVTYPHQGR
mgnify:FL=1